METQSNIRIIGGKWRSRKVSFLTKDALRPTPDRVRETLFNWLAPMIHGARCLDLFAGSGVLGLEALSRGAAAVTAIEQDHDCCKKIKEMAQILQAEHFEVLQKNVMHWLTTPQFTADIIFLDPPYKLNIIPATLALIEANHWLTVGGLVYFEQDKPLQISDLPVTWSIWRQSKASKVYYFLAQKES